MIRGVFVRNIPLIKIVLAWGQAVQVPFVILDTGFTGDLQVTPQMAKELGLRVSGVTNARMANGKVVRVSTCLAVASMEGVKKLVQVLISDSMPLAGISFLSKFFYKAIVDCKYKTIVLEKAI